MSALCTAEDVAHALNSDLITAKQHIALKLHNWRRSGNFSEMALNGHSPFDQELHKTVLVGLDVVERKTLLEEEHLRTVDLLPNQKRDEEKSVGGKLDSLQEKNRHSVKFTACHLSLMQLSSFFKQTA